MVAWWWLVIAAWFGVAVGVVLAGMALAAKGGPEPLARPLRPRVKEPTTSVGN